MKERNTMPRNDDDQAARSRSLDRTTLAQGRGIIVRLIFEFD